MTRARSAAPPLAAAPERFSSAKDEKRALPLLGQTRWTPELLRGVAEGEARTLLPLVTRGVEGTIDAAGAAADRAEQLVAGAMKSEPPDAPITCSKGCAACCNAKVLVVAPEVFRIAAHLRETLDEEALGLVLGRVREADEKTRGLSRAARAEAHVPCPLLDAEGGCSVHPVRPLVCRSWTSYDAGACERYAQAPSGTLSPPQYAVGYELTQAVLAGLGKACFDAGRDGTPLELNAALRIGLERPNAGERWHRRLPVLQMARDAEWLSRFGPSRG
jgi:Fe-S-cluster containining protein